MASTVTRKHQQLQVLRQALPILPRGMSCEFCWNIELHACFDWSGWQGLARKAVDSVLIICAQTYHAFESEGTISKFACLVP